jgi:hypothetical protein
MGKEIFFHTKDETMPSTGLKVYATRAQRLFRLSIFLAVAAHSNSLNAQQTGMSKAEAALAGKIKCEDFKKMPMVVGPAVLILKSAAILFPPTGLTPTK